MEITRQNIITALRSALEADPKVIALWEGGAAAFDRVDQWSDIDLQALCEDGYQKEVFRQMEEGLRTVAPIAVRYPIPEPTWHGHSQAFYLLEGTSPFLMIDVVVMQRSTPGRLREVEIHGAGPIHFDREGILGEEHIDREEHGARIVRRREQIRGSFHLFQPLVLKEIYRSNGIEALQYYHGMTLRPLLELLRMRHAPARFTFHTRYVYYDLPTELHAKLERLFFIGDQTELADRHAEAVAWVDALLAEEETEDR